MTRLFIHSTDRQFASRIKPEVYQKILQLRESLRNTLAVELEHIEKFTLEIGCGHGHFLTSYGHSNPGEYCIGIDVNRGRIFKAIKKVEKSGLNNVVFLECDSMEFIALIPSHVRLEKIWILYPDPWPKKRHFKNRIIQPDFLEKLAAKTLNGGQILIRSDYEPYLDWSRELITQSDRWKLSASFQWPEMAPTVFQQLTENRHFSLAAELEPPKERHQHELTQNSDCDQ